jgi:hypothetical protein
METQRHRGHREKERKRKERKRKVWHSFGSVNVG